MLYCSSGANTAYTREKNCTAALLIKLAVLLLCGVLYTANVAAQSSQSPTSPAIQAVTYVNGHQYTLELVARDDQPLVDAGKNRHYSGFVSELPRKDSWARVSNIGNRWVGMVAIRGSHYQINSAVLDNSPEQENDAPRLVFHAEPALASASNNQAPPSCGSPNVTSSPTAAMQPLTQDYAAETPIPQPVYSSSSGLVAAAAHSGDHSASGNVNLDFGLALDCEQRIDGACLVAEIEFAFDLQFQATFGAEAEASALALVNMVEGIYLNNFGIAFDKSSVTLLGNNLFSSSTDSEILLQDIFLKKQNNQIPDLQSTRSLYHLVTGRDFSGSTVGHAYIGTLCGNAGIGTSQLWKNSAGHADMPSTAIIIAHEIGHNFGALHDGSDNACGQGFIMQASISGASQYFSQCSVDAVRNKVAGLGQPSMCFDYPADVTIQPSAGNPAASNPGETFLLEYDVDLNTATVDANSLVIEGDVPAAEGAIYSASLDGIACNVDTARSSYRCEKQQPGSHHLLQIAASAAATGASFVHYARASNWFDYAEQLLDVSPADNVAISTINYPEQEPGDPSPPAANATADIAGNASAPSGGGGSTSLISLVAMLLVLLCRAIKLCTLRAKTRLHETQ